MKNRKENEEAFRMAIKKNIKNVCTVYKNELMITITCSHSIFLGSQL